MQSELCYTPKTGYLLRAQSRPRRARHERTRTEQSFLVPPHTQETHTQHTHAVQRGHNWRETEVPTCPLFGPLILLTSTPPSTPACLLRNKRRTGPLQLPSRNHRCLAAKPSTKSRPF
eukprot:767458-Hanusia_phi.AAC.1